MKRNVLVICGPTCSGKSELALHYAKKYNGEIISADSMQIYRELNIGTAKLPLADRCDIPHYMIDIVNPNETFSVAEYKEMATKHIDDILSRGKLPIICGGTGLYVNSLLFNYNFCNIGPDDKYRKNLIDLSLRENGKEELYKMLVELEPNTDIHVNNVKRVIRRLEILNSDSVDADNNASSKFNYIVIKICPDRDSLYGLIDKRVDLMFDLGLREEIQYVKTKYSLTKENQSMKAIGYREFFEQENVEDIKSKIKQDTRNYAKRQITWFKKINAQFTVDSVKNSKKLEIVL